MSTIWLNCELIRIETDKRLFNAIGAQNSVSYSNTCSALVTGSEKKSRLGNNSMPGEFLFHLRKLSILEQLITSRADHYHTLTTTTTAKILAKF